MVRFSIGLAVLLAIPGSAQGQFDDWNEPFEPVEIGSGLYYVGSAGLGAFLLTSDEGHILIDAPLEENVEMILDNIRALGFDPADVSIHLASHAHFDHVAGFERLLSATGGELWLSDADAPFVRAGEDFGFESEGYPPARPARTFEHGASVSSGAAEVTAHLTPGHTPGCTTWAGVVPVGGVERSFVVACSMSVLGMYQLVGPEATYPGHGADYCRSVQRLRALTPDIFLAGHGSFFDLERKAAARRAGDVDAFIDPESYVDWVARAAEAIEDVLAEQGHMGGCATLLTPGEAVDSEDLDRALLASQFGPSQ